MKKPHSKPAEQPSRNVGTSQERARAARVLVGVLYQGKTTDQTFGSDQIDGLSPLLQELVYGTLRRYFSLEPLLAAHLTRDFRSKDLDLRCLLLVGAYQLLYMRIPAHAAINETVNGCRGLRKPWARGLINAVLRKVLEAGPGIDPDQSFGLPDWIARKLTAQYPQDATEVLQATLERAPMSLRVNVSRTSIPLYVERLTTAGIRCTPGWLPENLLLDRPVPVRTLPGFAEGLVSVQDAGALFAARLLNPTTPVPRILDACAAPGGKLFHLAEQMPKSDLTGLELSPDRLEFMSAEAVRLQHSAVHLLQGDATTTQWHDGECFDAILLDAPCSGSGTLRRHPDIKILRQPEDLKRYAELQLKLLENLWPLLAPGGTLVYCTCSLFAEENDGVIGTFLETSTEARIEKFDLPVGRATQLGWQLVPLPAASQPQTTVDGFYFARLTRLL